MVGVMESPVRLVCHVNEKKAKAVAIEEGAISNGLLCTILSIQVTRDQVNFIGRVSRIQLQSRVATEIDDDVKLCHIRLKNCGHLHTTWSNLLTCSPIIGYVNIYTPIDVREQGATAEQDLCDENVLTVSMRFVRMAESLLPRTFGSRLCEGCGEELAQERLKAMPGTPYCVRCSKSFEKRRKDDGRRNPDRQGCCQGA